MTKPGLTAAPPTVWEIRHAAGIDPAPRRSGPAWRQFPHAQAARIPAAGFLHVDTALPRRPHTLILTRHGTPRMHPRGVTSHPTRQRTVQQARNLALTPDEQPSAIRFLTHDHGPNLTASVNAACETTGARILRSTAQAPPMNAIRERLIATLCRDLPDRALIPGQAHVRAALTGYQAHHNAARPHQGIAQHVPAGERDAHPAAMTGVGTRQIHKKPVLNGLINEYVHAA